MTEFTQNNRSAADSAEMLAYLVEQTEKQNQLLSQLTEKHKNHTEPKKDTAVEIDIRQFFRECLNKWLLIMIFATALTLVVLLFSVITYHPEYTSTVKFYVNNKEADSGSKASVSSSDLTASKNLVETYNVLLKTDILLGRISDDLSKAGYGEYKISALKKKITGSSMNGTEVFCVTVRESSPERAVSLADVIGREFPGYVESIISGSSGKIVDPATAAKREGSGIVKKAVIAFMIGLIVPMVYILLVRCVFNDSVESIEWVTDNFPGIPVLAEIPYVSESDKNGSHHRAGNESN